MNIQDWFPLGLTGLISLMSKGLSRVFPNTTVQKHQSKMVVKRNNSKCYWKIICYLVHSWPFGSTPIHPSKPSLVVVQSLIVSDFGTPWTAACQASLSFSTSQSLLKLMSIDSVMVSNHLLLYRPLLLLPSIFPSIRVFFQWVSSSHQLAKAFTEDLLWGISTSPSHALITANQPHTLTFPLQNGLSQYAVTPLEIVVLYIFC